jgi:hypothetical protein
VGLLDMAGAADDGQHTCPMEKPRLAIVSDLVFGSINAR